MLSLRDKTDVGHNTRTYAAFHKALSKETDDFDVILISNLLGYLCTNNYSKKG